MEHKYYKYHEPVSTNNCYVKIFPYRVLYIVSFIFRFTSVFVSAMLIMNKDE